MLRRDINIEESCSPKNCPLIVISAGSLSIMYTFWLLLAQSACAIPWRMPTHHDEPRHRPAIVQPEPRVRISNFSDTDQACRSQFPGSESEEVSRSGDRGFTYHCRLTDASLEGPFEMECANPVGNRQYEPVLIDAPRSGNRENKKGLCQMSTRRTGRSGFAPSGPSQDRTPPTRNRAPNSPPNSASSSRDVASIEIKAGSPGCVNTSPVQSPNHAVEAYITGIDNAERTLAEFISLHEISPMAINLGTLSNADHLSAKASGNGAVYRACTQARPGAGNLKLHIAIGSSY